MLSCFQVACLASLGGRHIPFLYLLSSAVFSISLVFFQYVEVAEL